jgi:hypothetical protein
MLIRPPVKFLCAGEVAAHRAPAAGLSVAMDRRVKPEHARF